VGQKTLVLNIFGDSQGKRTDETSYGRIEEVHPNILSKIERATQESGRRKEEF